jgi:hypothetical protein
MYTVDIGGHKLALTESSISYRKYQLPIEQVEAINVIRTDTYVNGAWVNGTRLISIRGGNRTLKIDCSRVFPDPDKLDELFGSVFEPIWSVVGSRLVSKLLEKLANGEHVEIGGVVIDRNGVWVDGSWKFLWWKAKPKLIPWTDLKIFSSEGMLYLQSISDLRFRSEIKFNDTENAMILDGAVRFLMHENNWKNLNKRFVASAAQFS